MFQEWILKYICCTKCHGSLQNHNNTLYCSACNLHYSIQEGIPIMIDLDNLPEHLKGQIQYFEEVKGTKAETHTLAPWQKSYLERFFESFPVDQNTLIIDSGTGSGYMAIELAKKGAKVIAMDLTLKSLLRLRKIIAEEELASQVGLVCCTAENLPIKSEVADYFVSFAVLEHLPREKEAIREITRVCKAEAGAMISVPIKYRYLHPLFYLPHIIFDKQIGHLRRYDDSDLRNKFEGWDLLKIYYSGHAQKAFKVAVNFIYPIFDNVAIEQQDRKMESRKLWSTVIAGVFKKR